MNYTQLSEKKKVEIDILLEQGMSYREVGRRLNISHSTISRYKNKMYKKRKINIEEKYEMFLKYLYKKYDYRNCSIEICVHFFKLRYSYYPSPSVQQVYNWINSGKVKIKPKDMCYKRRKRKIKTSGMMRHTKWNMENKTILPISLRPKYIENRDEVGHLEIDSLIGKKNESSAIITIVDRCTRKLWLIKAEYRYDYYTANLIYKYIKEEDIKIKSITIDNGLEFTRMGIAAKRLGVKLYKCDPYCSFQRGSNENGNGLVRRYLPKGQSFKLTPQIYLNDIMFNLNTMPRKMFDFKSASEIESIYK